MPDEPLRSIDVKLPLHRADQWLRFEGDVRAPCRAPLMEGSTFWGWFKRKPTGKPSSNWGPPILTHPHTSPAGFKPELSACLLLCHLNGFQGTKEKAEVDFPHSQNLVVTPLGWEGWLSPSGGVSTIVTMALRSSDHHFFLLCGGVQNPHPKAGPFGACIFQFWANWLHHLFDWGAHNRLQVRWVSHR